MLRKHKNNTDVGIEVLETVETEDAYRLRVRWWNLGACHEPWCMNLTQDITVPKAAWADWEPYKWRG